MTCKSISPKTRNSTGTVNPDNSAAVWFTFN